MGHWSNNNGKITISWRLNCVSVKGYTAGRRKKGRCLKYIRNPIKIFSGGTKFKIMPIAITTQ